MEKTIEVIEGEDDITVLVRPMFPFVCENYRRTGTGIAVCGEGSQINLKLGPEQIELIEVADRIVLCEFTISGSESARELILERVD